MDKKPFIIKITGSILSLAILIFLFIPAAARSEIINGCNLAGPRLYHPYTLRIPEPTGDTLPPGKNVLFLIGIFDTGSSLVVINNVPFALRDQGRITKMFSSASDLLDMCGPTPEPIDESPTCAAPIGNPPKVPKLANLDVRIWGLEAFRQDQGIPIDTPQAEIKNVRVRPDDFRADFFASALIGAPVANRVIAYIDFKRVVARRLFGRILKAPDIRFYAQGDSSIPKVLYEIELKRFPSYRPGPSTRDQATRGQRYFVQNVVFKNGGRTVSGSTANSQPALQMKVLFDTGTTTTQITRSLALALGINPDLPCKSPKCRKFRTQDVSGRASNLVCYEIDRVEIISKNRAYKYVISSPKVCVNPSVSNNAFGGGSLAILGTNYFEKTKILINGPNNSLGMFVGERNK